MPSIPTVSKQNISYAKQPEKPKGPAKLGDGVPTAIVLKKKYGTDFDRLAEDHEKLIEQILEDEEQLIFKHNASCKESIQIVEKEMAILKEVDKPGSDVEVYVEKLDKILMQKIEKMQELR
jgi:hypothetical protein